MFGAPGHFAMHAQSTQLGFDGVDKLLDVFQPLAAFFVQQTGNAFVGFRLLVAETQIFQLPFKLPHTQAVGQRCKDFQCFLGNAALECFVGHMAQIHHGAGAQSQLNQHHADVAHHRQQHLPHGFGLLVALFRRGQGVYFGEFGQLLHLIQTAHQLRHGAAAAFGHFGFPAGQIIGDVHQQSGRHRIGQQIHVGHHLCRSQQIIAQRLARQRGRLGRIVRTRQAPRRLHHAAVGFGQVGNIPVEPGKSIAGFNRRGGRIVGGNHKGITAANK